MSESIAVPAHVAAEQAADGSVVEAHELTRRYGEGDTAVDALRGVDLEVSRGKLTAVMGPSGSGKSTLMHILAALDKPTSGYVVLAGNRLGELNDTEITKLRRKHIGFVFQFFNLLPMLTAEENVLLPLTIAGEKPDAEWFEGLMKTVGLADRRSHRPAELAPELDEGRPWSALVLREQRRSPRDPRHGLTMLLAPDDQLELRVSPFRYRGIDFGVRGGVRWDIGRTRSRGLEEVLHVHRPRPCTGGCDRRFCRSRLERHTALRGGGFRCRCAPGCVDARAGGAVHGRHGPVRVRQVDADAHPRRARRADHRPRVGRR